uniref:Lipopolysaccharide export system permease protein LptF n=1 Tax=Candidatus Kentrum sp. FM TaxID=2126340 RepID=A0A450SNU1_9GAMM|nr:MAG: lipopolysaccharide export system permease protein [Candidatus Kentron sp. FM]VFJ55567.1 MAG: lipopolysaccharide export system permease protein [Candidatus Kentron sp. FM]VFK08975.1 MAG: lipopolysaccharide export system permease protein [Candidatus Kentron sp. FM]
MILNKYIYRETLLVFMAVLSILLLVYVSHRFVRYLAEAAAGAIPVDVIFRLLGLQLLRKLEIFMPIAFYISVLLSLGRMHQDNEITAMTSSGIGLTVIVGSIFRLSLIFAALTMILSLYVSPEVMSIQNQYKEKAKEKSDITGIYPGQFREIKRGERVIYVESISPDKRSMQNVFAHIRQKDNSYIVVANSAHQTIDDGTGERFIVLENGSRYTGEPGELDFVITDFKRYTIRIEGKATNKVVHRHRIDTLPTTELLRATNNPHHAAELQWRFSIPLSLIVLSLLAIVLARTSSGGGKYAKLVTAILAYFVYSNLLGIARMLVEQGHLNPAIGLLPVHGAVLLIIAVALIVEHSHGTLRGTLHGWRVQS